MKNERCWHDAEKEKLSHTVGEYKLVKPFGNRMEVLNTHETSWVWWYRSVVPVFKKLRQEDWAFEVS